MNEMHQLLVYI